MYIRAQIGNIVFIMLFKKAIKLFLQHQVFFLHGLLLLLLLCRVCGGNKVPAAPLSQQTPPFPLTGLIVLLPPESYFYLPQIHHFGQRSVRKISLDKRYN